MLSKFFRDVRGNFAMTGALAMMTIIIGAGAAMDFSSIESTRRTYQDYADTAVLAAVLSGEKAPGKLKKIAAASVTAHNQSGVRLKTKLQKANNGNIQVSITGPYKPIILGLFGKDNVEISVIAEASAGSSVSAPINVAFVLDVTNSMEGDKLDSMKLAATDLITFFEGFDTGLINVSLVPFA